MKKTIMCLSFFSMVLSLPQVLYAANTSIVDSKHNLSSSGPGEITALDESRICIFCHTPHHATPQTPLWNRDLNEGTNYQTYDSTTFNVNLSQPSGPSRLCLSCHDGTIGLGAVLSVSGGIKMNKELAGRSSLIGTDLRNDHPFSFAYSDVLHLNAEISSALPTELRFYNGDAVHCSTCHDPHDDTFGMFMAVDNKYSGLCQKCHEVDGWVDSSHALSESTWDGSGENPWPLNTRLTPEHQRTTVAQNGCGNCHTSHNAVGMQRLLIHLEEEKNCTLACHNGSVTDSSKNIAAQLTKYSTHPVEKSTIGDISGNFHDPTEDVRYLSGHVECQDCHDPHSANNTTATAPYVSGTLKNVSGRDKNGFVNKSSDFEYEICFKCHGDTNTVFPVVNRVSNGNNHIADFSENNPSFHPVTAMGRNTNVPSLPIHVPGTISLDPLMSESTYIYCSDCHSSDGTSKVGGNGPNGPHGSIYKTLLRENYATGVGQSENYTAYALCYRCHDRDVILSDVSFQKNIASPGNKGGHSGHLHYMGGTSCSVCHDPHGVVDDGLSGDHTNLINFDTQVVSPYPGGSNPFFTDTGMFSGSCTLLCHGHLHNGTSYP